MAGCKTYVQFFALLVLAMIGKVAYSQDTRGLDIKKDPAQQAGGKTYALVVGISRYQYPDCYPTLNYADVDARQFYNYLAAKTGGNLDPSNIDTLFNEKATKDEFWNKFNSIMIRLQKNDNFYIYFSGHGDAISSDLAYLLTYNAPPGKDKSGYYTTGGVVEIHTLKSLIKMITLSRDKPANVILITDACRSNELPPGKEEGRKQFYEEMYTKNAGEVQLVSCLANQVSFEDIKWGGGRGLFSWHLVNGLMGMADNKPEDGVVTLKELTTYVSDKVGDDAYDPANKVYRQTPDYCCRDKDGMVMAHVDKPTKERLAMQLKMGQNTAGNYVAYAGKGVNLGQEIKEAGYEQLYDKFIGAINENRLIAPQGNNAMEYLNELLQKNMKPELKSDLKFRLANSLMTDVTKVLNAYLFASTNNNNYTYDFFMTAAKKLRAFQTISDTLYYSPRDIKVNLLFLEGHADWHSTKSYVLQACLRKADSAIALKPQAAFLYNFKGLMHIGLRQYKEAEATLREGIRLAPNWLYPYHNLAQTFTRQGKYDSALVYYFKALALDSNYQTTYEGISGYYSQQGKMDSALHYNSIGLTKDPLDPNLWQDRGYFYYWTKDWKNALNSFYRSLQIDSTKYGTYEGALLVHLDNYVSADSVKYYKRKMIECDPDNPLVYRELGDIFHKFELDTLALNAYSQSLDIDSTNAETWLVIGRTYKSMNEFSSAEKCYRAAIIIDPTAHNDGIYNELGNLYFGAGKFDKALEAYGNAIEIDPNNLVYYGNYAYVALYSKDTAVAEQYYRKIIAKDQKNAEAYYELAKVLSGRSKNTDAIKMLDNAVKYGAYKRSDIEKEPAFATMLNSEEFKKVLKKVKE